MQLRFNDLVLPIYLLLMSQRRFNNELGGTADGIYGIVANLGVPPPLVPVFNAAFVLGMVFLERFYSVFDTTNNQIGLATTPFTFAETN